MWNKGGAWNTKFDDKKDEIGVLGICEANIGAENDHFHIDGYIWMQGGKARQKCQEQQ